MLKWRALLESEVWMSESTVIDLGLLGLGSKSLVVILCAFVCKHLRHGNGAPNKVRVVVQALSHLSNTSYSEHEEMLVRILCNSCCIARNCGLRMIL